MRVSFLVVLMSVALIGLEQDVNGQGTMRGMDQNVDLEATGRSIQMELIVEEIEDAGFTLDIEEGFEEEWEEEIWISSEEEFGSLDIDLDDLVVSGSVEITEVELDDNWEEIIWEEEEDEFDSEKVSWTFDDSEEESDLDEDSLDDLIYQVTDDFQDESLEEAIDPGWEEIIEEIEFDDLDNETEDDLDLLEEIYNSI